MRRLKCNTEGIAGQEILRRVREPTVESLFELQFGQHIHITRIRCGIYCCGGALECTTTTEQRIAQA